MVLGLLVLLCILAGVISPTFLQVANLINVLRQIALYGHGRIPPFVMTLGVMAMAPGANGEPILLWDSASHLRPQR
jgi:ribose/xylose/arabinose/galactoside ABC-type transport system permease subunit